MNCDNFLPALETGGFVRRIQARRHAARCPRCAAVRAAFAAAKRQLAAVEPLSPRARQLWERAGGYVTMQPSRHRLWMPAVAWLGAAACVLLLIMEVVIRRDSIVPQPKPDVTHSNARPLDREVVEEIDPMEGLSRLAAAVNRLDAELQRLQHKSELLNARQQVALTLDRFGHW
jgi:hypothetical protein